MSKTELSAALTDIDLIRRVLDGQEASKPHPREILILTALAAISVTLLVIELTTRGGMTENFLMSKADEKYKVEGLLEILAVLLVCVGCVYWLTWNRAREIGSTIDRVIGREMKYLTFHSFVPDLFLKFTVLAAVIWFNAPQLVGPILTAFVADYIFQGRFFRIPRVFTYALGGLAYIAAFHGIATASPSVLPSTVFFVVAAMASIANALLTLKRENS